MIVPPPGYLREIRDICTQAGILLITDEIQSGLGRTGRTFACQHEDVQSDIYVLGKALGGGIVPLSAVVSSWEVPGVFPPGQHGSTFGGNPLACAVGLEVCRLLAEGLFIKDTQHTTIRLAPPLVVTDVIRIETGCCLPIAFDLSQHTVESQAMSIYRKLGVALRGQGVQRVQEIGLLAR